MSAPYLADLSPAVQALTQPAQRRAYSALLEYARTPDGGWAETQQALDRFRETAGRWVGSRWVSPRVDHAIELVRRLDPEALHPSRRS